MTSIFDSHFARTITLHDSNGSLSHRAFIQPISLRSPESPLISTAGIGDNRRYLIILPDMNISAPATIHDGNRHYALLRYERIGQHIEGLLAPLEGIDYA